MNKVDIVSYTQTKAGDLSLEDIILNCARVSNPTSEVTLEKNQKLLAYLVRNKHWSPFEMAHICFYIETTRDISRQLLRHRSISFQEFSQRYAKATELVTKETRLQDTKNRQNSLECEDEHLKELWADAQEAVNSFVLHMYNKAIDKGIAKEVARTILPEGNTKSYLYAQASVRSWIHYCDVRCDPTTQKEHRELAEMIKKHLISLVPSLDQYFNATLAQ